MPRYEYKVVPAPARGTKLRGLKTPADRFAHALAEAMNTLGRDGWEYLRAESLPCEDRVGLLSKTQTTTQHVLVFRRVLPDPAAAAPSAAAPVPAPVPRVPAAEPAEAPHAPPAADPPRPAPSLTVVPPAVEPPLVREGIRPSRAPLRAEGARGVLPRLGSATGKGLFRSGPRPDGPRED